MEEPTLDAIDPKEMAKEKEKKELTRQEIEFRDRVNAKLKEFLECERKT